MLPGPVPLRRLGYRFAHFMLRIWWFLRRPHVHGVKFLLTDGDRVLLVRHTYGNSWWDIPGGSIRRGEEPITAARREAREELGVSVDNWRALGEMSGTMHHRHDTLHCFHIDLSEPPLRIDRGELADARWFHRNALPDDLGSYVRLILARSEAA